MNGTGKREREEKRIKGRRKGKQTCLQYALIRYELSCSLLEGRYDTIDSYLEMALRLLRRWSVKLDYACRHGVATVCAPISIRAMIFWLESGNQTNSTQPKSAKTRLSEQLRPEVRLSIRIRIRLCFLLFAFPLRCQPTRVLGCRSVLV